MQRVGEPEVRRRRSSIIPGEECQSAPAGVAGIPHGGVSGVRAPEGSPGPQTPDAAGSTRQRRPPGRAIRFAGHDADTDPDAGRWQTLQSRPDRGPWPPA